MYQDGKLWIASSNGNKISILPKMANRHGLIAGATGTGKTVTLKVLAESFSDGGIPVFLVDAKGDVAGLSKPGTDSEGMQKRITKFGLENFRYHGYPVCFWDVYGKQGHPLRTTISEMGPLLLAKLMGLNEVQEDILSILFTIADAEGLLLLDCKDLHAMVNYVSGKLDEYIVTYGNMTKQSLGAITRAITKLESEGGDIFFGEPALDIKDWFRTDEDGRGVLNILAADKLMNFPDMYGTFMLFMMSELFETLPEAGDMDKPKIVFFFDEAHMLFSDASKVLLEKIEQMVKLIRSKGVGIYFVTQSPADIPDSVLGQLGNRIQHALRAYTPAEQKAVKAAAQSFRENDAFKTEEVLTELGIGEALVSVLDEGGKPMVVERSFILPPQSLMGAITPEERQTVMHADSMGSRYDERIDRDSAYELLNRKKAMEEDQAAKDAELAERQKALEAKEKELEKQRAAVEKAAQKAEEKAEAKAEREAEYKARKKAAAVEKAASATFTTIGREVSRNIVRGLFKNLKLFK